MSLTSYRTAPPRVTDFRAASDTRSDPLKRLRGPFRPSWTSPHRTGRAAFYASGEDAKILKEALLFSEQLFAVGLADLAATYSPVP